MPITVLRIVRWEFGYWETMSTYETDKISEKMARGKLDWYRTTWSDRQFQLVRVTEEVIG